MDAEGKNGVTPLHVAVHYDNTSLALLLLEKASFPAAHAFILTQMRALSTGGVVSTKYIQGARGIGARFLKLSPESAVR